MKERIISPQEYDSFRHYLAEVTGIILGDNKHYLVSSRLTRLMENYELESYSDLLNVLKQSNNGTIREQIIDAMTTNETMWFRDTYPYEMLKGVLLPEFAKKVKDRPLKIWSSACSSGQEPYSISIIVEEFLASNLGSFPKGVQITGTDISLAILNYSKDAKYDNSAMNRGISPERIQRYFIKEDDHCELKPDIKNRVTFKQLNLQQSYGSLGRFDLIFCRNVLIYFSSELKTDILTRMADILNPDGYLLLGSSETPTRYTPIYKMIRTPNGVVYQNPSK